MASAHEGRLALVGGTHVVQHVHRRWPRHRSRTLAGRDFRSSITCCRARRRRTAAPPRRIEQAQKLLTFHFGPDGRIEIDKSVKVLAPIRNPANRAQRFDVLEVWGHIYKGDYRMRLIYARLPNECVLMGQEVLEYASL
jgi:hypothetical protein